MQLLTTCAIFLSRHLIYTWQMSAKPQDHKKQIAVAHTFYGGAVAMFKGQVDALQVQILQALGDETLPQPVIAQLEAVRLGCSYVVKEDLWDHESEVLASALLTACSGSVFLSNEVASGLETIVSRRKESNLLSEKEMDILKLIADGLSNKEIAKRQFVAVSTVKSHVSSILAKLQVNNRGKAAEWYRHKRSNLAFQLLFRSLINPI